MNPLENEDVNIDDLLKYYFKRSDNELININRIKRFYNDRESFNELMYRIIEKDYRRFKKLTEKDVLPTPWGVFFVILDIVQHDGKEIEPYDTLTKMFQSKSMKYMDWTFSWVHGENTIVSIYNPEDELVYRF